jgi:hypothetical protein
MPHLTEKEAAALQQRMGSRAIVSASVGQVLARVAADSGAKKGPRYQQRREGDKFRSDRERQYAAVLDQEKAAGLILDWQYEMHGFRIAYGEGGKRGCTYYPDFVVRLPSGLFEIRETKGKGKFSVRSVARAKFLAARTIHPGYLWRMIQWEGGEWVDVL